MIRIPIGKLYDKSNSHAELDVFDAYMLRVNEDWTTVPRFIDNNELICVAEGSILLEVNGKSITLSAGEVFVASRYSTLSSKGTKGVDCRFYAVSYMATLKRYECLFGRVLKMAHRENFILPLLDDLVSSDLHSRETAFLPDAEFATILEKLLLIAQWEGQDHYLSEIATYIAHHLDEPLTVEELSEKFHYAKNHMSRLFKSRYGMSAKEYVIEQKLGYAKRLLATSNMPIASVGASIGFSDEILFRKFFKYHVKCTPKCYRERVGKIK